MSDPTKVLYHSCDMQTVTKFRNSRKLKEWLRLHPNFVRDGKKYRHIYEDEFLLYQQEQELEQRNRMDTSGTETETPVEGGTDEGEDVSGGTEGTDTPS